MVSHWPGQIVIIVRFLLRFKFRAVFVFVAFAFADMMIPSRYTTTSSNLKTATCSALPVHLLMYRRSTRREGPAFVPPFPEVPSHGGICL